MIKSDNQYSHHRRVVEDNTVVPGDCGGGQRGGGERVAIGTKFRLDGGLRFHILLQDKVTVVNTNEFYTQNSQK